MVEKLTDKTLEQEDHIEKLNEEKADLVSMNFISKVLKLNY